MSQPCDVTTSEIPLSLPEPPLSAPDPVSLVSSALQNTSPDSTDIDQLIMRAFGATLCPTTVPDISANDWVRWWHAITHLNGRLYHVPGGSVGRKYVDLLTTEMSHLAVGNYPSERLIVFSAVTLQRNRMVRKGKDIRRVLERCLTMWTNDEFDYLVEEAVKCDKSTRAQTPRADDNHLVTVFTRLMLQGKVRAAVRWLSEQSKGKVLSSHCTVEMKDQNGSSSTMSVLDALKQKHPAPHCPPDVTLLKCESLPPRLDLEVTGVHIHHVASHIQGSAGPSDTDACHWQDVLLQYGAHSEHLCDSIVTLICSLSNTVTPWDDIRGPSGLSVSGT